MTECRYRIIRGQYGGYAVEAACSDGSQLIRSFVPFLVGIPVEVDFLTKRGARRAARRHKKEREAAHRRELLAKRAGELVEDLGSSP